MIQAHLIGILLIGGLLGTNMYKYVKDIVKYEMPDSPLMLLLLAVCLQLASVMMETLHLVIYSYNGKGFFLFDMISII